jgi:hypothetical protein
MRAARLISLARSGLRARRTTSQFATRIPQTKNLKLNSRQFVRALSTNTQMLISSWEEVVGTCTIEFGEEDDDGT